MLSSPKRSTLAFTLMEALIATAVLSVSVLAITYAVTAGQMQTSSSLYEMRAATLADALMEEVVALPYVPIGGANALGPENGETRGTFASADDYNGFSEAAGGIKKFDGTLYPPAYQVFSRRVDITVVTVSVSGTATQVTGLNVTVTVSDASGVKCQLQRFIR